MKPLTLSLATVALLALGLGVAPDSAPSAGAATPFWQLQGAAPSARDARALADLRLAIRPTAPETFVVARR